jgi:hypothetical protein
MPSPQKPLTRPTLVFKGHFTLEIGERKKKMPPVRI